MSVSPSAAPSVSDGDSLPPLSAPVSAEPSPKRHGHRHEREEPNGKPGTIAEARTWLIFPGWTISEGFKNNPLTSMIQFNDYLVERPDFRWNSESYLSVPSPRPGNSTPWPLTHTWRCPPSAPPPSAPPPAQPPLRQQPASAPASAQLPGPLRPRAAGETAVVKTLPLERTITAIVLVVSSSRVFPNSWGIWWNLWESM